MTTRAFSAYLVLIGLLAASTGLRCPSVLAADPPRFGYPETYPKPPKRNVQSPPSWDEPPSEESPPYIRPFDGPLPDFLTESTIPRKTFEESWKQYFTKEETALALAVTHEANEQETSYAFDVVRALALAGEIDYLTIDVPSSDAAYLNAVLEHGLSQTEVPIPLSWRGRPTFQMLVEHTYNLLNNLPKETVGPLGKPFQVFAIGLDAACPLGADFFICKGQDRLENFSRAVGSLNNDLSVPRGVILTDLLEANKYGYQPPFIIKRQYKIGEARNLETLTSLFDMEHLSSGRKPKIVSAWIQAPVNWVEKQKSSITPELGQYYKTVNKMRNHLDSTFLMERDEKGARLMKNTNHELLAKKYGFLSSNENVKSALGGYDLFVMLKDERTSKICESKTELLEGALYWTIGRLTRLARPIYWIKDTKDVLVGNLKRLSR